MLYHCILLLDWLSLDGKLILYARIIRAFSYGFLSIILAIYLKSIGLSDVMIGLVISATLVNSIIFTMFASFYADRIGRKKILILYAVMMAVSGAIFLVTDNYVVLIIAALIGTINVTGAETSAFLSLEQGILPKTIRNIRKQNTAFGFYNMAAMLSMSGGALLAGLPSILQSLAVEATDSFRMLFLLYMLAGITAAVIYCFLSKEIELAEKNAKDKPSAIKLSPQSKKIVTKLAALFSLDSFAGGFVLQSIVSFWFFTRFDVTLSDLSMVFSIAGVLTAFSFIVATKLADRIGLINTMVFTHIPSNALMIFVAFAPTFQIAFLLYLARMGMSQMDVPTRQSYLASVVKDEERIAAAGITNTSRNITQAVSPSIAGVLIQSLLLSAPFVLGGALKIIYDVLLYSNFKKIKPEHEQDK
ncbi:Major facilitator superfamily MFS_1 [Candidatus Nitrosotenuis uzonensis]|uniref:Major facilitator superfamily MFS_1 n=1 Tax=Candidatus Nitrosotenuis uzonensis TaxID=1407055 RepID=A0A812F1Q1_9ARCH|nr:Major facilitator superfamily MFS_1 [Candidatus Nitrosotenuis uzonensis]